MTAGPSPIELEEFELIQAAPGTALLRVTARAPAWVPREPTLLIHDDTRVHRLRPLPSPPEPEGWLRVVYSLRTAVFERDPSFSLELSQGSILELPDPHGHSPPPRPTHPAPEQEDVAKLVELEAAVLEANRWALTAQEEVEELTERTQRLEQALEDANRARRALDLALETLREQVENGLAALEVELRARHGGTKAPANQRSDGVADRVSGVAVERARARDVSEIRAALSPQAPSS